ncbi:hypothetical protein HY086_00380 [Candidatus Gottesmanbacteria bacterium]|nr:hypothetical protein [Candidatus Gottesmanbacteria bacterium]
MTITVSISQFRQNVSDYLDKVRDGYRVILRDAKKDEIVASIVPEKRFDPEAYKAMLDRVAGSISAKDHPEWATPAKISKWLRKIRKANERHFHVPA